MQEMVEDLNPLPAPVEFQFKPIMVPQAPAQVRNVVQHGRLKFSEIFASRVQPTQQQFRQRVVQVYQDPDYFLQKDEAELFMKPMTYRFKKEEEAPAPVEDVEMEQAPVKAATESSSVIAPVVLDNWEDRIVWDPDSVVPDQIHSQVRTFRNELVDDDEWTNAIVWDDANPPPQPEFHLNDPTLVIVESEVEKIKNYNPEVHGLSLYTKRVSDINRSKMEKLSIALIFLMTTSTKLARRSWRVYDRVMVQ
jgi:hypothetical protein